MSECGASNAGFTASPPPARAAVDATAGAGLTHDDPGKPGQHLFKSLPDPAREVLAGGVLESVDLVEVVVVEFGVQRLERGLDVGEVDDPTPSRIDLAADVNLDPEAMTVQSRALVIGGHEGQAVGRLERELLEDLGRRALRVGWASANSSSRASSIRIVVHTPLASFQAMT